MGRVIKFRAWDKKDKKMVSHDKLFRLDCSNEYPFLPLLENRYSNSINPFDVEIMEYTGLKDKNGRDIYEGDLLKDDAGIGEVEWVQEHCSFMIFTREPSFYYNLESDGQLKVSEVIGNIYENPELLEV